MQAVHDHARRPRVYLAGPDVFLPDPAARGMLLKAICMRHGLEGVFPLDDLDDEPAEWTSLPDWQRIALRNESHIRSCAALVANLTPFRGPSADAGTIFELGFMRALGRPVFGWSNTAAPFETRTRTACARPDGLDGDGLTIESFGCTDNLMVDGAVAASGGKIMCGDVPPVMRWTELSEFQRCVAACAAVIAGAA